MLAMLRKDFYVMGKYAAALISTWGVMIVVFSRILRTDTRFLYYLTPVLSTTIALNAISTDHECRWDRFAAMTPLRPWQLVLEKYCFAYGTLALLTGLSSLASWTSVSGREGPDIWLVFTMVSLFLTMALPLIYRFGRQKSSFILLAFWGLVAAAILGAAYFRYNPIRPVSNWLEDVPVLLLAAGTAAVLLVLNTGSVFLSIRLCARRQRGWYQ